MSECEFLRNWIIEEYEKHKKNGNWGTYDILLFIRRAYRYAKFCENSQETPRK